MDSMDEDDQQDDPVPSSDSDESVAAIPEAGIDHRHELRSLTSRIKGNGSRSNDKGKGRAKTTDNNKALGGRVKKQKINKKTGVPVVPRGIKYKKHNPDQMALFFDNLFNKGMSLPKAAAAAGIAVQTARDNLERYSRNEGNAIPKARGRTAKAKITSECHSFLLEFVDENPDATLDDIKDALEQNLQVAVAPSTLHRHLNEKCSLTLKRARRYPIRRTDDDTKDARFNFVTTLESSNIHYLTNCVFIDEASFQANMRRNYARSKKNEPAHIKVPKLRSSSLSLLAAICHDGLVEASIKIGKGGTKTVDFYVFLDRVMDELVADKKDGWNLVFDNAPIHTANYLRERVSRRGFNAVFLPKYSPFLNPIEEYFSKIKALCRRTKFAEKEDSLEGRMVAAMAAVKDEDYLAWINHSITFFPRCLDREDNL